MSGFIITTARDTYILISFYRRIINIYIEYSGYQSIIIYRKGNIQLLSMEKEISENKYYNQQKSSKLSKSNHNK